MRLSILEPGALHDGDTAAIALERAVQLARWADLRGFARVWLAEHHDSEAFASTAPEILAAHIAAVTSRIRVGTGAVLLPYYSPLKIAELFHVLAALHPHRIDLGIGRGSGHQGVAVEALCKRRLANSPTDYAADVAELLGFLHAALPENHPCHSVRAFPAVVDELDGPDVWLVGSSRTSAAYAAYLGIRYCYSHFGALSPAADDLTGYRNAFRPSRHCTGPEAALAVAVVCAERESKAAELADDFARWLLSVGSGIAGGAARPNDQPRVSLATTSITDVNHRDRRLHSVKDRIVYGTASRVREQLDRLCRLYQVNEVLVVTFCDQASDRFRSFELLASACELPDLSAVGYAT
jgi:luciferase family oxidoreductase group 1